MGVDLCFLSLIEELIHSFFGSIHPKQTLIRTVHNNNDYDNDNDNDNNNQNNNNWNIINYLETRMQI